MPSKGRKRQALRARIRALKDRPINEGKASDATGSKFSKAVRHDLQSQGKATASQQSDHRETSLTFGSLNCNGLTEETHWAVGEILKSYDIDVSIIVS